MPFSYPSFKPLSFILALALVALGAVAALSEEVSGAEDKSSPVGTSTNGVVPMVIEGENPGGNIECSEIGSEVELESSERRNWSGGSSGGSFDGGWPDGIAVEVTDGTAVSWTATFPVTAVIVKGSNAANVYLYGSPALSDGGLMPPVNQGGQQSGLSNLTFCWDLGNGNGNGENGNGSPVNGSGENGNGENGNGENGNGENGNPVGAAAVPAVPAPPVSQVSCDAVAVERGLPVELVTEVVVPILIENGAVAEGTDGNGVEVVVNNADGTSGGTVEVAFAAPFVVRVAMVTASEPVIAVFEEGVTQAAIALDVELADISELAAEMTLCGSLLPVAESAGDPTSIPTGGGTPVRTSMGLLGLVVLAMAGGTSRLLWSRGPGA